ncbi:MAG TPA: GNAT family N-acetyltransferase [Symbiobacteriaceae bacterium]|nr:GNAT family N-acetyltransferase [Symbiobacteriaceae bacterium]
MAHQLDRETKFMLLERGERTLTAERLRERFRDSLTDNMSLYLAAVTEDGRLVGLLGADRGDYRQNRHAADLWIGILRAYTGQGIGRRMFEAPEAWAREMGLHRLELTVMAHNARGSRCTRKWGSKRKAEPAIHSAWTAPGSMRSTWASGWTSA